MAWDAAKPFGLNQVKLVKSATVVTLRAAQTLSFTPRLIGGELKGNDQIVAVGASVEALEWSLEEGGLSLDALALVTGFTATTSGSTPSQINSMKGHAGTAFPYFKIYGKVMSDSGDDVHVKIWRAKITGNIEGEFKGGEFYIAKMTGIAVEDSVNGLYDIVLNETATTLPAA
jgi:hypothetical protein